MNNLFDTPVKIHEKYDLKGKPKLLPPPKVVGQVAAWMVCKCQQVNQLPKAGNVICDALPLPPPLIALRIDSQASGQAGGDCGGRHGAQGPQPDHPHLPRLPQGALYGTGKPRRSCAAPATLHIASPFCVIHPPPLSPFFFRSPGSFGLTPTSSLSTT